MSCGYVCPLCEGRQMLENGQSCDYCSVSEVKNNTTPQSIYTHFHLENFHVLLWLFKDACWMMNYKILGTFMVLPTLSFALYFVFKSSKDFFQRISSIAVFCWITANAWWMLSEFYFETLKLFALLPFSIGIGLMLYYVYGIFAKS